VVDRTRDRISEILGVIVVLIGLAILFYYSGKQWWTVPVVAATVIDRRKRGMGWR